MMNAKFRKLLSSVLVFILFLSVSLGVVHGDTYDWDAEMTRFGGENRYDTSAQVSAYLFESSEYVVIARGDEEGNYADALAGSYLAGFRKAPLLLTRPNALSLFVATEITRLGAIKAYILGGTGAVQQAVEDALTDLGLDVVRLSGARREDTAAAIVDYVRSNKIRGSMDIGDFVFIVNGRATADALVGGSFAYRFEILILLVNVDSLPSATGITLSQYAFDRLDLVGGFKVMSEDLEDFLDSEYGVRQRIAGTRRFETSVEFAEMMFPDEKHYVFVAGPDSNLADGISAAAFGLPILYLRNNSIPLAVRTFLNTFMSAFSHLFIMGGTAAVSPDVADGLTLI